MGSIPTAPANPGAAGIPYFTPAQIPAPGTALDNSSAPTLFQPITTRGLTLQNRFVVAPMCTYSAQDGHMTDWHLIHLGKFAIAGAGLIIVEATAVEPRGRISPSDVGLWADSQVAPLRRIVDAVHGQGGRIAVQIAHAGRKASMLPPWVASGGARALAGEEDGGWAGGVVAPSAISYGPGFPDPVALSVEEIKGIVVKFAQSAKRAVEAGVDVVEIHGAHGYLIHQFLSPVSNQRTDDYGGSFENRTRFLREIIVAVRAVIPDSMPLWLRISATEWLDHLEGPSWDINESIRLAKLVPGLGVDVLDVSSSGNHPDQRIMLFNAYQTDLAGQIGEAVRAEGLKLQIAAVGLISEAETARSVVQAGGEGDKAPQADFVLAARQFLRDPQWVLRVAHELGVQVKWPHQYQLAKFRPSKNV